MIKGLLFIGGIVSLGVGIIGLVLPLVPSTPLFLLSAVCFARSAPRFHAWLLSNRWFGEHLRNYHEGRGISAPHKAASITLLWLSMGYAALAATGHLWLRIALVVIAGGVTWHLLRIPTFRRGGEPATESQSSAAAEDA